jgi:hypothetical protein
LCLPDVPEEVIARYPGIAAGVKALREAGFGILVKDASLGGRYPVMNVTLLHPKDQGVFPSFGAHPRFEIALERALTELLQGRSLESLGNFPEPGFDMEEIAAVANLEIHFVDSSGVVSWNFLSEKPDHEFADWNFSTTTQGNPRSRCAGGTVWKELRIGELKTLLALAIGDEEATREGCDWIHHYRQMNQGRWLVYRCIEVLLELDSVDDTADFGKSLVSLYGGRRCGRRRR